MPRIRRLKLSNNYINEIDQGTFHHLENLGKLWKIVNYNLILYNSSILTLVEANFLKQAAGKVWKVFQNLMLHNCNNFLQIEISSLSTTKNKFLLQNQTRLILPWKYLTFTNSKVVTIWKAFIFRTSLFGPQQISSASQPQFQTQQKVENSGLVLQPPAKHQWSLQQSSFTGESGSWSQLSSLHQWHCVLQFSRNTNIDIVLQQPVSSIRISFQTSGKIEWTSSELQFPVPSIRGSAPEQHRSPHSQPWS